MPGATLFSNSASAVRVPEGDNRNSSTDGARDIPGESVRQSPFNRLQHCEQIIWVRTESDFRHSQRPPIMFPAFTVGRLGARGIGSGIKQPSASSIRQSDALSINI
jgi:hypothetical protein